MSWIGDNFLGLQSQFLNFHLQVRFFSPYSSDSKIIDKSYTTFPSDFHKLICSGVDEMGKEILNTKYVSVPRGSEYFSFHLRNSSEEQLFQVEDERYELDSYLNMLDSTISALK